MTHRWRLFVCNAYLIPAMSVNADNASCQQQDERAAELGRVILSSKPDVVMLQECWGAGQGSLERELTSRYDVVVFCRSWFGVTLLDSALQFATARGGLYFAHDRTSVSNAAGRNVARWRTFSVSKTRSKKGMLCVRYTRSGGDELLVFNTHLDPTNEDDVQLAQLSELGDFIHDCVAGFRPDQTRVGTHPRSGCLSVACWWVTSISRAATGSSGRFSTFCEGAACLSTTCWRRALRAISTRIVRRIRS